MPTAFSDWIFLIPLKKAFLLPDSSLGLIDFNTVGGLGGGYCGGAPYLFINIRSIPDTILHNQYPLFYIQENSCDGEVTLGDTIIQHSTIKNISWTEDNSLFVAIRVYSDGETQDDMEIYKISFASEDNKVIATATKEK